MSKPKRRHIVCKNTTNASPLLQVMPYSTGCMTPLSNFEAGLNYKDVPDPAVKVSFPLDDDEDNAEIVIWTTTPW